MAIVKYTAEEAKKLKISKEDLERFKSLTEEEIEKNAREDEDNPLLADE